MTQTQTAGPDQTAQPQYATAADTAEYGEYRIRRDPADTRPLYRFTDRVTGEAGRFHLYSGWFCPWAQRSTLVIALAGLGEAVPISYVDGKRDARGWAFRRSNGPDPVNGFTLLRQAYEATEPGFDGHVSVPTLWDKQLHRVASNDYGTLDADLASHFLEFSSTGVELYPQDLRPEIDELERWLLPAFNQAVGRAAGDGEAADAARVGVLQVLTTLEQTFSRSRYLLGDRLTLADVRLFVTLARYDLQANATGRVGPHLPDLPNLWGYARELYQQDGFRATTRFESFTSSGASAAQATADWSRPVDRSGRVS